MGWLLISFNLICGRAIIFAELRAQLPKPNSLAIVLIRGVPPYKDGYTNTSCLSNIDEALHEDVPFEKHYLILEVTSKKSCSIFIFPLMNIDFNKTTAWLCKMVQ